MKKSLLVFVFAASAVVFFSSSVADPSGKYARTGAPSETTCKTSGCHNTYALNTSTGSISITSDIPNWEYTPGQTYNVSVTLAYTGRSLFGFNVECLNGSNANFGTFTAGTDSHLGSGFAGGTSRSGLTHKTNGGATADAHTFNFTWKAPAAGSGAATFYFAGICANSNGNESGDYVYSGTQAITEFIPSTGVTEVSAVKVAKVFPMPATNNLNVTYVNEQAGNIAVKLYAMDGTLARTLLTETQTAGEQQHTFDVSGLPAGTYLLQISNNGSSTVQKVSIQ